MMLCICFSLIRNENSSILKCSYQIIWFQICRRHSAWSVVTPKAPQGFKDYLMVSCNYVLQGNAASKLAVPLLSSPNSLEGPMRELFIEQEKARYKLRLQHVIEKVEISYSLLPFVSSLTW